MNPCECYILLINLYKKARKVNEIQSKYTHFDLNANQLGAVVSVLIHLQIVNSECFFLTPNRDKKETI